MPKIINKLKSDYTQVPNEVFRTKKLSWKAIGIYTYLFSKPDDWNFYMDEIKTHATDGIKSLQTGVKELEEQQFLIRKPSKNKSGKLSGWDWMLTLPSVENRKN